MSLLTIGHLHSQWGWVSRLFGIKLFCVCAHPRSAKWGKFGGLLQATWRTSRANASTRGVSKVHEQEQPSKKSNTLWYNLKWLLLTDFIRCLSLAALSYLNSWLVIFIPLRLRRIVQFFSPSISLELKPSEGVGGGGGGGGNADVFPTGRF